MEQKYEGEIEIAGEKYSVEVVNGERFIDGMAIDVFMATQSPKVVAALATVGAVALKDETDGIKPPYKKYQYITSELTDKD